MFLHLSVSHSVHSGEGVSARHPLADTSSLPGRHPLDRPPPLGRHSLGRADNPERTPLWADSPLGQTSPLGKHLLPGRPPPTSGKHPLPGRRLLLRTVRILLICILVLYSC